MDESTWLAERFEEHRSHLRAVAYRMLGSISEAEDAVQDSWLRVSRAGADEVENIGGWLTTVVSRVCLNMLRSRNAHRQEPLEASLPDPIVTLEHGPDPGDEAVLADSVGLALQIVLDTLSPAERLAFVLHDMFDLPFDEIGPMVDRTPEAARQLASRARRRVKGAEGRSPERDPGRQRAVVDAFYAAARSGDIAGLLRVLDPDVVLRADFGMARPESAVVRGAEAVAQRAKLGAAPASEVVFARVNGTAGAVITRSGAPFAIMAFTVSGGRIIEIDIIGGADRVGRVAAAVLPRSS